jgi:hypothetical protein
MVLPKGKCQGTSDVHGRIQLIPRQVNVLKAISWSWRDATGPKIGGCSRAYQLVMEGYNRPAGYTGTQVVLPTGRVGDKGPSAGHGGIQQASWLHRDTSGPIDR